MLYEVITVGGLTEVWVLRVVCYGDVAGRVCAAILHNTGYTDSFGFCGRIFRAAARITGIM